MTSATDAMADHMWAVYLGVFLGPFVQEDAAVIGAVSLAAASMAGSSALILLTVLLGLSASDLWKYWLGSLARSRPWAARMAEGPRMRSAGVLVKGQLGKAVFAARFIPGTRIALYVAAGYFEAGFARFAAFIVASAALLIGLLFVAFKLLGEIIGDKAILVVSVAALTGLAIFLATRFVAGRRAKAAAAR